MPFHISAKIRMPFALVLDLGIDLGVALQADRAAQVVHGPEVFHPARIEDLEQDGLLHLAHLGPVLGVEGVEQERADLGRRTSIAARRR